MSESSVELLLARVTEMRASIHDLSDLVRSSELEEAHQRYLFRCFDLLDAELMVIRGYAGRLR